ncbi:MAG: TetR/AcrR family transcriptional regulator, partial [Blautia sp.]|nr:TetR/AcrR family transcriptional regulator [Blautia sp.]
MNGHERRAAATREALKDALLELLCKKPFSEVTIAALCREAKVGRATFYTHYTGLTDIVDEVAEDAIEGTALS